MRIVRRKRSYYIRIFLRLAVCVVCVLAGVLCGTLFHKAQLEKSHKQKRIFISVLKENVEAGTILKESLVERVPVINEQNSEMAVEVQNYIGKRVKQPLNKGCVLTDSLLCDTQDREQGLRKVLYSFVRNTDMLNKGMYIDLRVSFPNGADFTVLGKKQVIDIQQSERSEEKGLWLALDEEEILRMSSAVVDAYLFEGAYLYAVIYLDELQEQTIVNYPVNQVVEELMKKNPNIIKIAQKKMTLGLRGKIYENTPRTEEEGDRQGGLEKQDSLLYFD